MENHGASEEKEFGKEVGLMSEVIVTGRKVGANREFWKVLAHNKWLFKRVIDLVKVEENKYLALAEWARFYKEVFRIEIDFSDISIPEKRNRFDWLIVMLKGLTLDELCVRAGGWLKLNLGKIESIRKPIETYAVWLRIEADDQIENKIADDCAGEGISGITLEERLLFDRFYYWRTGKHPESKILVSCTGSLAEVKRNGSLIVGGSVPCVHWASERLNVDLHFPVGFAEIYSRHAHYIISA
ncbi:MAG: hypothetical protein NTX00_05445 [Candidatus Parcubacteria bacterium]|nr:hypothetical protein [Candidatus Parcubacteria bacterium]